MKIAQIAPIWSKIPPNKFGGTETMVHFITEGLVKKGHDVTLFATADSQTSAILSPSVTSGLLEQGFSFNYDLYHPLAHFLRVYQEQDKFDILHFHFTNRFDNIAFALSKPIKNAVFTLHTILPQKDDTTGKYELFTQFYKDVPMVSISDDQRKHLPLNF